MSKPYVHSHTAIKEFEQCPRKFEAKRVLKLYPYVQSEAARYGDEVHKALEDYTNLGEPLPKKHVQFLPVIQAVLAKPGRHKAELAVGVRRDLSPCDFFDKKVWLRGKIDHIAVDDDDLKAWVVDWKGLPLHTRLPTPTGWTTMGQVAVGDTLFNAAGDTCKVTGKSQVKHLPCYEILFDDTSAAVCDQEHLWALADGRVVCVQDLQRGDEVAVAAPLSLPEQELAVDPYVLGLWLADGKNSSAEISKPDAFVWAEIQRRGLVVNMETGGAGACPTRTVQGIRSKLDVLGVLGNKHIPPTYLRGSYEQRLDLLRGLMDGDGNANPHRKQAVFTTTDKKLSDQVFELLCSLGQRPLQSTTRQRGFGLEVTAYPLSFRPVGLNPFLIPRKRDRIDSSWGPGRSAVRRVLQVSKTPSVPTQCIAVDSSDRTFLCTEHMIPTHNTGKNKYPDFDQMTLMSLFTFAHYGHLRQVNSAIIFLLYNDLKKSRMVIDDVEKQWWKIKEKTAKIEKAIEVGQFPPKPGPLCPWCEHTACEHHPKH